MTSVEKTVDIRKRLRGKLGASLEKLKEPDADPRELVGLAWPLADTAILDESLVMATNLESLLKAVGENGWCRSCGADIFWLVTKNGKKAPYTPMGLNHFADCASADRHR